MTSVAVTLLVQGMTVGNWLSALVPTVIPCTNRVTATLVMVFGSSVYKNSVCAAAVKPWTTSGVCASHERGERDDFQ
ncbi:hypothetical protein SLA2020_342760 [Shorea laevis]